jgi:hypothetical protein
MINLIMILFFLLYVFIFISFNRLATLGLKAYILSERNDKKIENVKGVFIFIKHPTFLFKWDVLKTMYPIYVKPNLYEALASRELLLKRNKFVALFWVLIFVVLCFVYLCHILEIKNII